MRRILGVTPAFIRPPYGGINTDVRKAAYIRNQSLVLWDLDVGDPEGVPVGTQNWRYTVAANNHPNNILALNHETYKTTA